MQLTTTVAIFTAILFRLFPKHQRYFVGLPTAASFVTSLAILPRQSVALIPLTKSLIVAPQVYQYTSPARPQSKSLTQAQIDSRGGEQNEYNSNSSSIPPSDAAPADTTSTSTSIMPSFTPRVQSCIYMCLAMALHFGGYEFARSGGLALFTSNQAFGDFPSAYPLAIGLVTQTSLLLLYWYGVVLKARGPRQALQRTSAMAVILLSVGTAACKLLSSSTTTNALLPIVSKLVVGALFVFQNSYAHLLYTQQWSFLGSVMTPTEGTQWFSLIAGVSSVVCTITATMVHTLTDTVGLLGLLVGTIVTLAMSMVLADTAYRLSEQHGFDPSPEMTKGSKKKSDSDGAKEESLLSKTNRLFRTSPTLAGLFGEVISFQSLSTVLNVCFVRQLKDSMPVDTDRAAFTGRFYALVNGTSGLMQFLVLPLARKYLEPQWTYRFLPLLLMPLLIYAAIQPVSSLWVAAMAFFALKASDYSIRNVANEMVYQPLDFDSRYLGKEVIGVFANRFGKSGMSLILSGMTSILPPGYLGARQLSQLSVVVGSIWTSCSVWLSKHVVTNKQAEAAVQERQQKQQELEKESEDSAEAKKAK